MNIKNFFSANPKNDSDDLIYTGSSRRGFAAAIDMTIVLFLRAAVAISLGALFVNQALQDFLLEFREKFGTDFIKNNPDHINYVTHHRIFFIVLFFYAAVLLVGAIYHALLNSSIWQATIGKRLFGIIVAKEDGSRIKFNNALAHYCLSLAPFLFVFYLIIFHLKTGSTLFQAITASEINVFFGLIFLLWTQIHLFTKKKTTAYDMICKVIFFNKRISATFPWSEKKVSNFL